MTVTLYESASGYSVVVRGSEKFEKSLIFNTKYLEDSQAFQMAQEFATYLQSLVNVPQKEIKEVIYNKRKALEDLYVENGMGVAYVTRAQCYACYFKYVDGPSPEMRMGFGVREFGENRAKRLAKEFSSKYHKLKKKKNLRDKDIDELVNEYEKVKILNQFNKMKRKRRKQLKHHRAYKYFR